MSGGAGVLRSATSLGAAAEALEAVFQEALRPTGPVGPGKPAQPGVESWETSNLLCVARVLVAAALERRETRGCHWRDDFPERDETEWRRHLVVRLGTGRALELSRTETPAFPAVHPVDPPVPREPSP